MPVERERKGDYVHFSVHGHSLCLAFFAFVALPILLAVVLDVYALVACFKHFAHPPWGLWAAAMLVTLLVVWTSEWFRRHLRSDRVQ